MDYQGNSNKNKEDKEKPTKNIEKVVTGSVIIPKKSIGRKAKEFILAADFKGVAIHFFTDVLVPAGKNTVLDTIERMLYGDSVRRRSWGMGGSRVTLYNTPVNRGSREITSRFAPPQEIGPRRSSRYGRDEFILSSKEEAELVLERMNDIIDQYDVASVADLNELVGLPTTHVDNKWGWNFIGNVAIRSLREGFLIDFPPPEPL